MEVLSRSYIPAAVAKSSSSYSNLKEETENIFVHCSLNYPAQPKTKAKFTLVQPQWKDTKDFESGRRMLFATLCWNASYW